MVSYMDADLNFQFSTQAPSQTLSIKPSNISANAFNSKNEEAFSPLKMAIINWLKTLNLKERFKVFLIDSVKISQIILKMYWKQQETGFKKFAKLENEAKQEVSLFVYEEFEKQFYCRVQHETDFLKDKQKRVIEAEKEILSNIKILDINGIYDSLCFHESYLSDIDAIIRVFTAISEDKLFLFETNFPYTLDEAKFYFPDWFHPHQFQTLSTWVVSYLETSIKQKYFNSKIEPNKTLNVRDNAEDFLQRMKNIKDFWNNTSKQLQEKFIEDSIVSLNSLKEDAENVKELILNPEIIKFYLKYKEKISLAGFSSQEILFHYKDLMNSEDIFFDKILFESLNNTTTQASLCNKIIQNKILLQYSQSLVENKDISKKKKKKKTKKKSKNPESFMLFDKKTCVFTESPEKDKTNFCEISIFSQSIAKDLITIAIKGVKTQEEDPIIEDIPKKKAEKIITNNTQENNNKIKDTPYSPPNRDHKTTEHIEHQSETTCTKDTKSVTESDFPNIFDDLAIFDEMDKQKLSKKQKKKLKKKKKNNKTMEEDGTKSGETEIIPLKEEKNSENSDESVEKSQSSGKKEKKIDQEKEEPQKIQVKEKIQESEKKQESGKKPENDKKPESEKKIEKKKEQEKPQEVPKKQEVEKRQEFEKRPETPKIQEKPSERFVEKQQNNLQKPQEKPLEKHQDKLQAKSKFPEEMKDEFIEVTKKSSKSINRDANKRFAPLGARPEPYKSTPSKGPAPPVSLVKKESFEDRFKIEKDSRKKTIEIKAVSKPGPHYTAKSTAINHKPINTTDIEPIESLANKETSMENQREDGEEKAIKTEHGVTLCKKKHAKEVLMAKIKRKEIEKQQKGSGPENAKYNSTSREKPIEILNTDTSERKTLNHLNDPVVKKEYRSLSQKIFWRKMENDLNLFTENIAMECKRMKVFRLCLYDRIEFIVSNLFEKFGAHIKMYGSCVTGLELPYSDMDIGISGFEKYSKYETESILSRLLENLSYMKWVKLCKPIFTASVPLLKLELDPTIAFNEFTYPNPPIDYINSSEKYNHLNVKAKTNKPLIIKVDISLENVSNEFPGFILGENVGTLSTNLINHYLHIYPNLHKLIIVCKHFLYQKEFNKSYQGGISSYCLSLMIIAYLMEHSHKYNLDSPEHLTEIFHFYGKKFNPKETGISLKMKPSPFFKIPPNTEYGKLIIYEPITNSKNLALNTFLIDKILNEFANVYDRIECYKLDFENRVKQFNYSKMKLFEKLNYSEIETSKDLGDLMKTDVVEQIICEEY